MLIVLCENSFKTMVKFVVDIKQNRIAVGGDLHADGESLLLKKGSDQEDQIKIIFGVRIYIPIKKARTAWNTHP